ncbi:DUF916 domain-containing protein [Streptomyces sp. NBC_00873]|uniref:COG1470 family protein n=1 Tax=Streptomyces sp. NBC_00873 TaxID=2975852 RepID=UPI0038688200|nr:DUF916 domain-containing protein [Streptomyces sp. NBC_00873]
MPPLTGHAPRAVLAALLCAFVCAFSATPATAADRSGTDWTAQPAAGGGTRSGEDGGRPYFYLEGLPGTVLQDRLSVTNPGTAPVTVRLRGADAYNAEGGDFTVRGTGDFTVRGTEDSTGTGTWLRLAADRVTVPARTRAEVPFSVTVPAGASPGDHPGAIVAENSGRSVGVRVHLRVSGPTLTALTVEEVSVSGRTIHYTLVNRGNAALAPRLAVSADGAFGTLLRREARNLPVDLLPGQRVKLTEPWRDAPALDSATVRLRVTAAGGAQSEATAPAVFVPWAPVTGGALLVLAAAAAGAYAYRLRRSHRRPPGRDGPDHGDAARTTAGRRHSVKAGAEL